MSSLPFLRAENVSKSYGDKTAIADVSFDLGKGKIMGLLGPNGAGKTTLIRIINRISYPDNGDVWIEGEPVSENTHRNIGYLPEERGLYKKMKVGEQAMYLAQLKGLSKNEAKRAIMYWFEKFEITDWWNKRIEELSKGMAQKVQFITTVVHKPKLLILDEPFSGFDPINANLIKNEILDLNKKGTSIILSTHNMKSVEELCDNIVLINHSKVILKGRVETLKERYKEGLLEIVFKGDLISFTQALWVNAKLVDKQPMGDGLIKTKVLLVDGFKTNDLLKNLINKVEIISLQELRPTMDEIFIKKVTELETTEEGEEAHHG